MHLCIHTERSALELIENEEAEKQAQASKKEKAKKKKAREKERKEKRKDSVGGSPGEKGDDSDGIDLCVYTSVHTHTHTHTNIYGMYVDMYTREQDGN